MESEQQGMKCNKGCSSSSKCGIIFTACVLDHQTSQTQNTYFKQIVKEKKKMKLSINLLTFFIIIYFLPESAVIEV